MKGDLAEGEKGDKISKGGHEETEEAGKAGGEEKTWKKRVNKETTNKEGNEEAEEARKEGGDEEARKEEVESLKEGNEAK